MKQIILASQSPRRKEILEKLQIPFICQASQIDETLREDCSFEQAMMDLAKRKAMAIFEHHQEAIVIGSDTLVVCHGQVFGKPKSEQEAYDMLKALTTYSSCVITALAIVSKEDCYVDHTKSDVYFLPLKDEQIYAYLQTKEYMDKAGGYAIQGFASKFISRIDGDYYSIMGLPIHLVYQYLDSHGYLEDGKS